MKSLRPFWVRVKALVGFCLVRCCGGCKRVLWPLKFRLRSNPTMTMCRDCYREWCPPHNDGESNNSITVGGTPYREGTGSAGG